jgi:DNA-binding transcriptional ArsR family regulator
MPRAYGATAASQYERLCREGDQTVGGLTAEGGVSQPVVSRHLGVLKRAGLARDRREGRNTYYRAQPRALAPLVKWTGQMVGSECRRFHALEALMSMDD